MLFMGQEILEDKYWSDAPKPESLIWWDGLASDMYMHDFYRFSSELIKLRRRQPALRGEKINVFYVHNENRIIAYHRWLEQVGRDVVVIVSLNGETYHSYELGFPVYGEWLEVFNSDFYDHREDCHAIGNGGKIYVNGQAKHDLPYSSRITIPANSAIVFALDRGDNI
jgi:1,4-alpha-glucan branching enzyme